jgi:hypothetical protein
MKKLDDYVLTDIKNYIDTLNEKLGGGANKKEKKHHIAKFIAA